MEKVFKLGVYMKSNGNLVTVETIDKAENVNMKYMIIDGRKCNGPIAKLLPKNVRPDMVLESSSLKLGWGPSAYMNKCEYLGEL